MILWLMACSGEKDTNDSPDEVVETECLTDEEYFSDTVSPILQSKCIACHSGEGIASETTLVLSEDTQVNFDTVSEVATVMENGQYLLLTKPTNQHTDGHSGGQPIAPSSTDYDDIELFVARINGLVDECATDVEIEGEEEESACEEASPARRVLRRLSHQEYNNTIQDLFGLTGTWSSNFAGDNVSHGFDNAVTLQVSPLLLDQYSNAATQIADDILTQGIQNQIQCGTWNRDCAEQFLSDKGTEIFRRPLSEADIERYLSMYDFVEEDGFDDAMKWMIASLLQSPHFLYRSELGVEDEDGWFGLTSWEIATELSYLFWQSTPDGELLELAAEDLLRDSTIVSEQVERLASSSRSSEVMVEMGMQWLGVRGLEFVAKDSTLYPELTDELRDSMSMETELFLATSFQEDVPFSLLLTDQSTRIDTALANHYGVQHEGTTELATVDFSTEDRFGGLLGHASLLTVHALPSSSSPIHRGLLVREHFLCQELPPPPANLNTSPPEVDPDSSTRERYEQHSSDAACSGCHDQIDPIGFGFEHYDGIGRWRTLDGIHSIDASGAILNSDQSDGTFYGVEELSSLLADSSEVSSCYVQQWFVYGTGQGDMEIPEVSCGVEAATEEFVAQGSTVQSALKSLTLLDRIYIRSGETGEMDTFAQGVGSDPGGEGEDTGLDPDTGSPETPLEELTVQVIENSNWGTGYCSSVTVANTGTVENTWMIELPIVDTITSLWSANSVVVSGGIQFTGVDWNATLQPNQSTEFGFCASL